MPFSRSARARSSVPVYVWSDDDVESEVSTNTSDVVPSLTRGNSTSSVASSAETDMASNVLGEGFALQLEDGVLTLPNRYQLNADLLCPFQILDCDEVFAEVVDFKLHVFSHFQSAGLPSEASCFLCEAKWRPDAAAEAEAGWRRGATVDSERRWNSMLSHMVNQHYRQGQRLATVRTDFKLMRWMWDRNLISKHQFKRTQLMPIPFEWPGQFGQPAQIINLPHAPAPPSATSPVAIEEERARLRENCYWQEHQQPYTLNAGIRSERRRRAATRFVLRSGNNA